jgi:hypothetical protein
MLLSTTVKEAVKRKYFLNGVAGRRQSLRKWDYLFSRNTYHASLASHAT